MAPRKEKAEKADKADKTEKVTANQAVEMVLTYLRKQNRPYSAVDISSNLHNRVTKAAAAKILKDLHEKNEIEGRAAGKAVVYHALQDPSATLTPDQLTLLDTRTSTLRTSTSTLLSTAKTLRSTLSALQSTLSTSDLRCSIAALEQEKSDITTRLESLRVGKAKKVTPAEREQTEQEWRKWIGVRKRREGIEREVWRVIEDLVGEAERRAEIREALGLDE